MANFEQKAENSFSVMGAVEVTLPGDVIWHAEDIDNALHKGAIFRGSTSIDGKNVPDGYVLFCDVSRDTEEPDTDQLTSQKVPGVEAALRVALGAQFSIISVGETKLLTNALGQNVLISSYIVNDGGTEMALVSLRTSISGAKWISVCACSPVATVKDSFMQVAAHAFRL